MVNHIKLIRALTLSSLSSNTNIHYLPTWKGEQPVADITLPSPFFSCQGRGSSRRMYIPYLIELLCPHIPLIRQFSHQLLCWRLHSFLFQPQCWSDAHSPMLILYAHSPNIEEWVDERSLAISVPKSTITLFTPQFAHSNTHPQVTLNNSILPLRSSLQIQCPCQIFCHPSLTP